MFSMLCKVLEEILEMHKTWSSPSRNSEFGLALYVITSLSIFQISVIYMSGSRFSPYPCAACTVNLCNIFL